MAPADLLLLGFTVLGLLTAMLITSYAVSPYLKEHIATVKKMWRDRNAWNDIGQKDHGVLPKGERNRVRRK